MLQQQNIITRVEVSGHNTIPLVKNLTVFVKLWSKTGERYILTYLPRETGF